MKLLVVSLALLLVAPACKSKSEPSPSSSPAPRAASAKEAVAPTHAPFQAIVGPQAPVVSVSVWPAHWEALHGQLQRWGAKEESLGKALGMLDLKSSSTALSSVAHGLGYSELEFPVPGLLADQPITLEFFPSRMPFEQAALMTLSSLGKEAPTATAPWMRLYIPTNKAAELAESLMEANRESGKEVVPGSIFLSDSGTLRITAQGAELVVDLALSYDEGTRTKADWISLFGPLPKGPSSPAFGITSESALRVRVSAAGLGDLGASFGMMMVAGAIPGVDRNKQQDIFKQGLSEVLTGFLFMDPSVSVASHAFLDVPADGSVAQASLQLTTIGQAVAKDGGIRSKPSPLTAMDWRKAMGKSTPSALLKQAKNPRQASEIFYECGWACYGYLILGNALQLTVMAEPEIIDSVKHTQVLMDTVALAQLELDDRGLLIVSPMRGITKRWKSLMLLPSLPAASQAEVCLREAWVEMRGGLRFQPGSEEFEASSVNMMEAVEKHSECATQEKSVAARYGPMRSVVELLGAS